MDTIALALLISGSLMIVLATAMSTIWLPKMDKSIRKLRGALDDLYAQRQRLILIEISNGQNKVRRRIDFFELNSLAPDREEREELKRRILQDKADFVAARISYFGTDERIRNELSARLEQVTGANGFDEQLDLLNQLESESVGVLQGNMDEIQNGIAARGGGLDEEEDRRSSLFWVFQWLQVVGLILISVFTIIENIPAQ